MTARRKNMKLAGADNTKEETASDEAVSFVLPGAGERLADKSGLDKLYNIKVFLLGKFLCDIGRFLLASTFGSIASA